MKRLLLAACLLTPGLLRADDAPCPAPPPPPHPNWTAKAEASFVGTSGNSQTQTIGLGAEGEYKPGPWSVSGKGVFVRQENENTESARRTFLGVRVARNLEPRLAVFVRGEYFQDVYAGIDRRLLAEGGVAFEAVKKEKHLLRLEAGLGYTDEVRLPPPDLQFASGRLGALYQWKISNSAEFSEEGILALNLQDGGDWRYTNRAALSAALVSRFSMKVSYGIAYLHQPPAGRKNTDTTPGVALVAKF
jgi:putative salt-induced outer membrane protein